MKSTHPPFKRMAYIDEQLRKNKFPNCTSLAQFFDVDRKTIQKDIDFMKDPVDGFGAPIEFNKKMNGYYYTKDNFFIPAINLSEGELFAFLVAEKTIKQYENTPFEDNLKRIFNKISKFLPDRVKVKTDEFASYIFFQPEPLAKIVKIIYDTISAAVKNEIETEITYFSMFNDTETDRTIQPYYLLNKHGDWYVYAYCTWRKEFRLFALQRIKSARLLDTTFYKDDNINKNDILGEGLDIINAKGSYDCEVQIDYPVSLYVQERAWHNSQKIKINKDKSINISFTLNSLQEIKRWILSMGSNVRVIKPKILKDDIKSELEAALKNFQ